MTDITRMCTILHNFFTDKNHIFYNTYTIHDNIINVDFINNGQYFRITGSSLNNGVYCNDPDDLKRLKNETFTGAVWVMDVPPDFVRLCDEVERFNAKIAELSGNFQGYASESWGGYSYTLPTSAPTFMQEWQHRIKQGMNCYRKIN
ncbi:MAG: hypothetical protein NC205_01005 [Prevotella sp.]|nr:hypothetical protein [Alistipes senegalensis]MCM1357142.1 hypothetical protein [Prevotella sp.]MCM1472653.1 hypothetical protein [Muribaculaceae bacterium]